MIAQLQLFLRHPANFITVLLLLVSLPHFLHIPWWSSLTVLLLATWRILIEKKTLPYPGRFFSAILTLFLSLVIYKSSGSFAGITAGSHLLVVMSFCKLIESKTHRDYMLLTVLSFFIISTNFLYTQDILIALYMFICLIFTLITLMSINQKNSSINLKQKLKISSQLTLYSLPIMIILFIFFPRITGPLWKTDDIIQKGKTGLSDSMEPGQISQLVYSNELAFRARFENKKPENNQLYWRAIVLWDYDGKKWTQGKTLNENIKLTIDDPGFTYTITIEPHQQKWLFLLDLPYSVTKQLNIRADFTTIARNKVSKRLQYTASSTTNLNIASSLKHDTRLRSVTTPDLNTKTRKLAESWRDSSQTDREIVNKALQFFSSQNFFYTLSPPLLTRKDSVDQFLFETRRGFCEHYSSAFAVLMRHANIPSRIVLGYQGGIYNPLSNEYSVDQSMAHGWTEVWLDDQGWVRVDPTAAIAPNRVEINLVSALDTGENIPLHLQISFPGLQQLRHLLDAIDSRWNQWVLNYNEQNQQNFLQFLTGEKMNLKQIAQLFLQVLLATLIITAAFYFLKGLRTKTDPVKKAYQKFCKKIEKLGISKVAAEGPDDFRNRILAQQPALAKPVNEIISLYIQILYQEKFENNTVERFIRSVKQFRPKKVTGKPSS